MYYLHLIEGKLLFQFLIVVSLITYITISLLTYPIDMRSHRCFISLQFGGGKSTFRFWCIVLFVAKNTQGYQHDLT